MGDAVEIEMMIGGREGEIDVTKAVVDVSCRTKYIEESSFTRKTESLIDEIGPKMAGV